MTATVMPIPAAKFRPATADDGEWLWRMRREQERAGREQGWYHGRATTRKAHALWFQQRFGVVRILIWERGGVPLGYVRIESDGALSFYPHSLDAVPMLAATWALADQYGGRLKVTVDRDNYAASEALEAAGFTEHAVRFHLYRSS